MEEDKTVLLFRQIQAATKNGHDAEVRRDKDGNFVVYSVKKQRAPAGPELRLLSAGSGKTVAAVL